MNIKNIQNLIRSDGRGLLLFNVVIGVLVFSWVVWLFVVSFKSVPYETVEVDEPTIEIDSSAYDRVDKYLGNIEGYDISQAQTDYENSRPFAEYPR